VAEQRIVGLQPHCLSLCHAFAIFVRSYAGSNQKELCHRKRGCRWQSDVAIGNIPSAKFSSENTCLPIAKADAIGKRVADGRGPIGKPSTSSGPPSG